MTEIVTAAGLVLVIEGLIYALAPGRAKAMLAEVLGRRDEDLRLFGLVAVAAGVFVVWLARG